MAGVAAWVSAQDVPGENKVKGGASDSPVFADGKVEHMGQVIGLVIADTPRHAQDAAAKVSIQYGHPKAGNSLQQSVQDNELFQDTRLIRDACGNT